MKNTVHYCPICLQVIRIKYHYPIQFKDNMVMLQFGTCIIILRKIYINILLIIVLCFGFYINIQYFFFTEFKKTDNSLDQIIKFDNNIITWDEMIKDCGAKVMIENSARANEIFKLKYHKKEIVWKGYFLNAFLENPTAWGYNHNHMLNINVRMIPSESLKHPDLFLSLSERNFKKYKDLIALNLNPGAPIEFRAVIENLGNEWRTHHFHLIDLKKTFEFIDEKDKIFLFQGATLSISGHKMHEGEIVILNKENKDAKLIIDEKTKNGSQLGNENERLKYLIDEEDLKFENSIVNDTIN